jgi:GMP synthase (glutamine-hydrolysing)
MMIRPILIVQHMDDDGPGLFQDLLTSQNVPFVLLESDKEALPETLDEYSALVVLGGHQAATDNTPPLVQEKQLIRQALRDAMPYLGICLGGQLLAAVCGADIQVGSVIEVGFFTVPLTEEGRTDPLFADWTGAGHMVFDWHHDHYSLPDGAVLLERGEIAPLQAFRVGTCAYGVQHHPELTPSMLKLWMRESPDLAQLKSWLSPAAYQRFYEYYEQDYEVYVPQSLRLFTNFLRIVGHMA